MQVLRVVGLREKQPALRQQSDVLEYKRNAPQHGAKTSVKQVVLNYVQIWPTICIGFYPPLVPFFLGQAVNGFLFFLSWLIESSYS
jgi:hypothetical protein